MVACADLAFGVFLSTPPLYGPAAASGVFDRADRPVVAEIRRVLSVALRDQLAVEVMRLDTGRLTCKRKRAGRQRRNQYLDRVAGETDAVKVHRDDAILVCRARHRLGVLNLGRVDAR